MAPVVRLQGQWQGCVAHTGWQRDAGVQRYFSLGFSTKKVKVVGLSNAEGGNNFTPVGIVVSLSTSHMQMFLLVFCFLKSLSKVEILSSGDCEEKDG